MLIALLNVTSTRIKWLGFSVFFILAIQNICIADVTKLPMEYRHIIEDSSRFHEIRTTTNLPSAIVALCADNNGLLAEPDQQWQEGDVTEFFPLPSKRLIWAEVSGELYIVHYESGGRGHGFHILIATLANGEQKPNLIWHAVGDNLNDYSAFLNALRDGELDDILNYSH